MAIEAILFDFDGVLVDTEKLKAESHKLTLSKYGIKDGDKFYQKYQGLDGERISQIEVQELELEVDPSGLFQETEKICRRLMQKGLPTIDSSIDFLKKVAQSKDFKTGIVTSVSPEPLEQYLNTLALRYYFDAITTVKEVIHGKDYSDLYILAAKKLSVPLFRCAVIEDSRIGALSAKQAGMYSIGFKPKGSSQNFEEAANLVVDDLNKIDFTNLKR